MIGGVCKITHKVVSSNVLDENIPVEDPCGNILYSSLHTSIGWSLVSAKQINNLSGNKIHIKHKTLEVYECHDLAFL